MIEGIVKKIMFTGISKYSKKYEAQEQDVQIKITIDGDQNVVYEACKGMIAKEKVTFLEIMDKKFDIFSYEGYLTPFIRESLFNVAKDNGVEIGKASCFIVKHGTKIYLVFYDGFNIIRQVVLQELLQEAGL